MKRSKIRIIFSILISLTCISAFGQTKAEVTPATEVDSMNYRGKREPVESGEFKLVDVSALRLNNETVQLDLLFNQIIDPNSITGDEFYIDGKKSSSIEKPEFSRDGKRVRIQLEVSKVSFDFEVRSMFSYNGKAISESKIKINV